MPLTHVLNISKEAVTALTAAVAELGESTTRTAAYAESLVISKIAELVEANPDLVTKFPEAIEKIQNFNFKIFGIDLGTIPSMDTFKNWAEASSEAKLILLIPILSGITSLMTSVLTQVRQKKTNPDAQMQGMGCMMLSMPLMSLWFTFQFPAGMGMYWILSNVFAFFQALILGHFYAPRKTVAQHMVAETIERRSYEKAKKAAADKEKNEQN
jgi:YidC/Oxa1 family membrane protein insertase